MKRLHSATAKRPRVPLFQSLLSCLHTLTREELVTVHETVETLLTRCQQQLLEDVPDDVWKRILSEVAEMVPHSLLYLGCVCKRWQALSDELLLHNFSLPSVHSNSLLRKFNSLSPITSLNLDGASTITNNTLRLLSDLTVLDLVGNPGSNHNW